MSVPGLLPTVKQQPYLLFSPNKRCQTSCRGDIESALHTGSMQDAIDDYRFRNPSEMLCF